MVSKLEICLAVGSFALSLSSLVLRASLLFWRKRGRGNEVACLTKAQVMVSQSKSLPAEILTSHQLRKPIFSHFFTAVSVRPFGTWPLGLTIGSVIVIFLQQKRILYIFAGQRGKEYLRYCTRPKLISLAFFFVKTVPS